MTPTLNDTNKDRDKHTQTHTMLQILTHNDAHIQTMTHDDTHKYT